MSAYYQILDTLRSISRRLDLIEDRLDASDEEMVGISEACKILRCTRAAIYRRIDRGKLLCTQEPGDKGRYRFNRKYLIGLTKS